MQWAAGLGPTAFAHVGGRVRSQALQSTVPLRDGEMEQIAQEARTAVLLRAHVQFFFAYTPFENTSRNAIIHHRMIQPEAT